MFDAHVARLARIARLLLSGWLPSACYWIVPSLWRSAYSVPGCYLQGKGLP
jgi:hypothetical protein